MLLQLEDLPPPKRTVYIASYWHVYPRQSTPTINAITSTVQSYMRSCTYTQWLVLMQNYDRIVQQLMNHSDLPCA